MENIAIIYKNRRIFIHKAVTFVYSCVEMTLISHFFTDIEYEKLMSEKSAETFQRGKVTSY